MINISELFVDAHLPEPLTKQQIYELFKRYENGDVEARDTIIVHNIKLVLYRVMKKFKSLSYDKQELVEIGLIGLIKSVDTFNISKNVSFSSYASVCIDNEILMFIRKNKNADNIDSLDESIQQGDSSDRYLTLKDILSDCHSDFALDYEHEEIMEALRKAVFELDEKDREIIKLYFGFYNKRYTLDEIGKKYNISRSYVSRLKIKILSELKVKLEKKGITKMLK